MNHSVLDRIFYNNPELLENISVERTEEIYDTFRKYTDKLAETLTKKNIDYGNSVFKTGISGILVRILDKQERIRSILNNGKTAVENESLEDTFWDLAGYSLLALITLNEDKSFYDEHGRVLSDTPQWTETKWVEELLALLFDRDDLFAICSVCRKPEFDTDAGFCRYCMILNSTFKRVEGSTDKETVNNVANYVNSSST